ncbi:MAG: DUF370 domain-containing protein [Clostridiaceae bacterium]|nr:DUF370 domain-containing protein [Clostridiaceae bacterium]
MFLHLGGSHMVYMDDVVGFFDLEKTSISKITREYLKKAQNEKKVINVSDELPKSFIITKKNNSESVYISPISTNTLNKRTFMKLG